MKSVSDIDHIYSIAGIIIGLVMLFSPRTLMRKAKYDEESLKTESLLKKVGIGLILICIIFSGYIIFKA